MRALPLIVLPLAACTPLTVCDTAPRDVIGVHVLPGGAGAFEVPAGEAVVRSLSAEMDSVTAEVAARYTLVSASGAVTIDRVDCDEPDMVLDTLSSERERLQPVDVSCDGACMVELCLSVTNAGDAVVQVDDAVTVAFTETLACGEPARDEADAPIFSLDVVTLD